MAGCNRFTCDFIQLKHMVDVSVPFSIPELESSLVNEESQLLIPK